MKPHVVLIILDGWGIGRDDQSNPIYSVNPPVFNYLKENFPYGSLQASGIAVGLPWREEGNSEVGHLNLGAGKVLYQNYPRISMSIRDKSFFQNKALLDAFSHAKKNNSAVNLIGLLSNGIVHSAFEHLKALIEMARIENVDNLNLHLIADGRDSEPHSVLELLNNLPMEISKKIASLAGRYYAMDRDKNWERIQKYYDVITGKTEINPNIDIESHIKDTYKLGYNDEYVAPILFDPKKNIKDNDAIIFFNFREDRMREIASSFIDKDFAYFPTKKFSNLYIVQMVSYADNFKAPVAFSKEIVKNPLSKVLADTGKTQIKIAETEKYAHVTYFFNGENEEPYPGEYRILVPSRKDVSFASHPEMRSPEITSRVVEAINEESYDLIVANYASPDMVAHTGDYEASLKAVQVINDQIDKIIKAAIDRNSFLIITADHGNIEKLFNPVTGESKTKHDSNPVPIHLVAKELERESKEKNSALLIKRAEKNTIGILADIAPTILEILKLPKPKEMTGKSLLKFLI